MYCGLDNFGQIIFKFRSTCSPKHHTLCCDPLSIQASHVLERFRCSLLLQAIPLSTASITNSPRSSLSPHLAMNLLLFALLQSQCSQYSCTLTTVCHTVSSTQHTMCMCGTNLLGSAQLHCGIIVACAMPNAMCATVYNVHNILAIDRVPQKKNAVSWTSVLRCIPSAHSSGRVAALTVRSLVPIASRRISQTRSSV